MIPIVFEYIRQLIIIIWMVLCCSKTTFKLVIQVVHRNRTIGEPRQIQTLLTTDKSYTRPYFKVSAHRIIYLAIENIRIKSSISKSLKNIRFCWPHRPFSPMTQTGHSVLQHIAKFYNMAMSQRIKLHTHFRHYRLFFR